MPDTASARTRVLLTGATGNWGRATLRAMREFPATLQVSAFSRDSEEDRAALDEFVDMENLQVIWGDLTDYSALAAAVGEVDIVLHVGAVVSPFADEHPELAWKVNVESMANIVRAVKALPEPGQVAVVGVGSVAETGNRNPPKHWGRIGDPIRVSRFDEYGQTKVVAEKILVDSGLPKWAWLRQTGIFHPGVLQMRDPIMTHPPLGGVLEWVSAEDSARLLTAICQPETPESFWGGIYNIGGGDGWRLTNWDLQVAIGDAMGVADIRRWYKRHWFALKNFHGQWFTDSHILNDMFSFREDTFEKAMKRAIEASPSSVRNAGRVPAYLVRMFGLTPVTRQPRGTMAAIRDRDDDAIAAHFGSLAEWKNIGDWSTFTPATPSRAETYLDHGYDEGVARKKWNAALYKDAAASRGGTLLTEDPRAGDIVSALRWRCGLGHEFSASSRLVLTGGHWCPECTRDTAGYAAQAVHNSFLAQLEPDS